MSNGFDYDLSRLAYREWNEQFKNLYVPLPERRPTVLERLVAALHNPRTKVDGKHSQPTAGAAAAK